MTSIHETKKEVKNKFMLIPIHKLIQRSNNRKSNIVKPSPKPTVLTSMSLLKYCTFVYDQGELGSCTANAFCTAYRVKAIIQNKYIGFVPSRLFFYYNERVIEDTVAEDAGADVVDGEAYVKTNGICSEALWPYNISRFDTQPPTTCFTQAKQHKIKTFQVLPQTDLVISMQSHLNNKEPLLIAIAVYDSFMSESVSTTGVVPLPDVNTETCQGGHEMCVLGYDNKKQAFQVMNSWGTSWGQHGTCWIPYTYFQDPSLCFEVTLFSL